ncbi:MAG TPA: 3-oxoacyl-[acyl-carrier-protein] synthase III C-terminal domain-containing protein [Bryobacteraceae bacterium]
MSAYLHAFGAHLPPRVVSNAELADRLKCTPEWIESVSGIRERRWAGEETTVADLAFAAAEDCLTRAGADRSKLGMVIVASGSAPPGFPGPAAEVAARLGLENAPVLDLPMASAGSLFGMALASRLADSLGDILVVGAEKMSAVIQAYPLDQNTAILFGDGAGAVLISNREGPRRILHSVLHTSGELRQELSFDWKSALKMNGGSVILHAARKIPSAIREVLEHESIAPADVSTFLVHQANQNLLVRVAKALAVPTERVFSNIARYGNTSSASLLIAAAECESISTRGATEPVAARRPADSGPEEGRSGLARFSASGATEPVAAGRPADSGPEEGRSGLARFSASGATESVAAGRPADSGFEEGRSDPARFSASGATEPVAAGRPADSGPEEGRSGPAPLREKPGPVVFAAFGAGFHWGALVAA